jgi:hypothetical protein
MQHELPLRGKNSQVIDMSSPMILPHVPLCAIEKLVSRTMYLSGLQVRISAKAAGNTTTATKSLLLESLQYISMAMN